MARKVLIIGPPTSGKTCLLGAADIAAGHSNSREVDYGLIPRNSHMKLLLQRARETVLSGSLADRINADAVTTRYEFDLRIVNSQYAKNGIMSRVRPWHRNVIDTRFNFLDGPGGALLPVEAQRGNEDQQEIDRFREEMIAHARDSESLMLCIDSHNERLATSFFVHLPTVLHDIAGNHLHFRRIAIVLTKADMYFSHYRRNAKSELIKSSPWKRAASLLTTPGMQQFMLLVHPKTEIGCGWASAYGFIANEGTANLDPANNCLRTYDPDRPRETIESWLPFRVLDPFAFLANGTYGSMEVYTKFEIANRPWEIDR